MHPNENPHDLWKREDPGLPNPPAAADICARARNRERESIWAGRIWVIAFITFALAFAHNIWTVQQPWVRLGQTWMLVVVCLYLWSLIRNRPNRQTAHETCAEFLLRLIESRRKNLLALRRLVLWIIPGELASWLGRGPALKARAMGLDPSSPYYHYLTGGWPFLATSILLMLIWLAFSHAARKASGELESLRQRTITG
jgi:hypothetical protein